MFLKILSLQRSGSTFESFSSHSRSEQFPRNITRDSFSHLKLTCEVLFGSCWNCPGFIGISCLWKLNSGLGKLKS